MSASNVQPKYYREEDIPDMPPEMKDDMLGLFQVQATSRNEHPMVAYLVAWLEREELDYFVDDVGNILVEKGYCDGKKTFYPCICSHMDTVHQFQDNFKLKIKRKGKHEILLAHSGDHQVGTGGDDKCGIFSCLMALKRFDNIKVAFFSQEEAGLIGSSNVEDWWFDDVGYIIQLDRWGRSDFICKSYYEHTVSEAFLDRVSNAMLTYGYKEEEGLITDSINLWQNGIGVSAVNVSCGYYQHHTPSETVDLNEFYNSLMFTIDIICELGEDRYDHDSYSYADDDDDYYNKVYNSYSNTGSFSTWKNPKSSSVVSYDPNKIKVDLQTIWIALTNLGFNSVMEIKDIDRFYEAYDEARSIGDYADKKDVIDYISKFYEAYY